MHILSRLANPRYYQIMILTSLLVLGMASGRFEMSWVQPAIILFTAWAVQYACCYVLTLPFDWRSPLISTLSLTLLLRVDNVGWLALAALLAISSKFIIRVNNKHVFNPANFGIVALLLLTDHAWVSPGQWGSYLWLFFLLCCLAQLVLHKAARSMLGGGFLVIYAGLLAGRAFWLGDPIEIPLHQLQNGAVLIFAFFMISDPKSTPDSKAGQLGFALVTALIALYFQFELYNFNHLFYALALTSLTTPLWDRWFPATPFQWPDTKKEIYNV